MASALSSSGLLRCALGALARAAECGQRVGDVAVVAGSTVRGSSSTAPRSMRATIGGSAARSAAAKASAPPGGAAIAQTGDSRPSPGSEPPPIIERAVSTEAAASSPQARAQRRARRRSPSAGAAIMRQIGISSTASPRA